MKFEGAANSVDNTENVLPVRQNKKQETKEGGKAQGNQVIGVRLSFEGTTARYYFSIWRRFAQVAFCQKRATQGHQGEATMARI